MFGSTIPKSGRALILVSMVAAAVFILFYGLGATAGVSGAAALSPLGSGDHPVEGPPARLRIVDLRNLPPAIPGQAQGKVLPFRNPRGAGALGSGSSNIANIVQALNPAGYGAPGLIVGFNGINSEESGGSGGACGCVPPDGDMAVGPSHVIVAVNEAFRVFNKSGVPLTEPVGFDSFFGSCGASGLTSSDGIAVYDPVANRFTVGILRYDGSTPANAPSWVSLAVSRSSDPTGQWNQYCFRQDYQGVEALYDFPHISVGQTALFTTGNLFLPGSEQNNSARVNAYPKALMYAGAITATQVYSDVTLNSDLTPADTIRPVLFNMGLPSATSYFVNVSSTSPSSRVTLWRWTDPFGANVFEEGGGVNIATFAPAVPMLQPTPGSPMPPPAYIDNRTLAGMWYNGTVYAAHTAGCNAGSSVTDCVQWYQLGNINGAPTIIQQGMVGGANQSRSYPDLAVDQYGNVELSYAYSSLNDHIGIRHTGRLATDPLGDMGPEATIKAGEMAEVGFNATRWGDYSGSVLDPDGVTLWHFEEYSQNISDLLGSWGTWTSASRFPPPGGTPTPTPQPTGSLLIGHVTWQGRPAQPNALQQLAITLTLKSPLAGEVNYPGQTTDASGFFTVSVNSLLPGPYSWRVKDPKYLANSGSVTLTTGTTRQEMGLMRAGDCNDDNVVTVVDFNIMKSTFGRQIGEPGYDDRADFTGDQVVNISDFNLLKLNFGTAGAPPIHPGGR